MVEAGWGGIAASGEGRGEREGTVSRVTGATLRRAPELALCPAARLAYCDWPGRGAGHVICDPARGRRSDH